MFQRDVIEQNILFLEGIRFVYVEHLNSTLDSPFFNIPTQPCIRLEISNQTSSSYPYFVASCQFNVLLCFLSQYFACP